MPKNYSFLAQGFFFVCVSLPSGELQKFFSIHSNSPTTHRTVKKGFDPLLYTQPDPFMHKMKHVEHPIAHD